MMMLRVLSDVIVDCLIAAIAAYLVYRGIRHIKEAIHDHTPDSATDPASAAVWEVLAEARRITEQTGDDHATG